MDRDRKIMLSSIIGGIVIVAIIITAILYPSLIGNKSGPEPSHFNLNDFNSETIVEHNNTLKTLGLINYQITPPGQNSSFWEYYEFTPPRSPMTGLIKDQAVYVKDQAAYMVNETMVYQNYTVCVVSDLTGNSVRQSLIIENTETSLLKISFSFNVVINSLGNTTLYNFTQPGSQQQNFTIVPRTYGLSESYSLSQGEPLGIGFPYFNETIISWSQLSALYNSGTVTFNQRGTQLIVEFSQVSIPPGDTLNLGTIYTSD